MSRSALPRAAAVVLMALSVTIAGCSVGELLRRPSAPFDLAQTPPAPDYNRPEAWLAFPGRNGLERSTPPGLTPVDEADAPADVFFIHPTTFLDNAVWNAPWDAPDDVARLNPAVLLNQVSAFNGCCRLHAPRYRQATLAGLSDSPPAVALAYADVSAAFRVFIARHNNGRPFIIASHSQGTAHAIRLLQEEILATPLQDRLVAAYLIGGYVPDNFGELGLPDFVMPDASIGVFVLSSMPRALQDRLHAEVVRAVDAPRFREALIAQNLDSPRAASMEQLRQTLEATTAHNKAIIEKLELKIRPE